MPSTSPKKISFSDKEQSFLRAVITEAAETLYLHSDQDYHNMDAATQKITDTARGKILVIKKIMAHTGTRQWAVSRRLTND